MKGTARRKPTGVPASMYRLQLNRSCNFRRAADLVEYFDELGISDCYISPVLAALQGSLHGYDVTDHGRLSPDLGTGEEFAAFAGRLKQRGMGLVLDLVPNHMCIADASNSWWWDVLENGPSSPYSRYFDIEWNPPKQELADKVLLPVLGDQYGRVLESQQIAIFYEQGAFLARFNGARLPLAPRSWPIILEPALAHAKVTMADSHPDVLELESILTALSYLPPRNEKDEDRIRERQREKEVIKRRLSALYEGSESVRSAVAASLGELNGRQGEPRSFDRLERLLADQAYRLSYWRVAADEINYRRFFDINDLAAIRVEDPDVFSEVHALILDLIRQRYITGLRVDHPDGLFDPQQYFRDLQAGCMEARDHGSGRAEDQRPFFVIGEKILTGEEELRHSWEFQGTTGYGFLRDLNGLFVGPGARRAFERIYQAFTGWSRPFDDLVYECKKLILQVSMSSELNVLARRLDRISEQHRWSRDFTLESLREALRQVIACFPIYRTYIREQDSQPDHEDERHIRAAIAAAKLRNPAVSESTFDFIQNVLLLRDPDGLSEADRAERRLFVMHFQQLTSPVMAKGLEDTASYRYFPLASLNEVGGSPERFGVSVPYFHRKNAIRRASWPNAALATSTHDTKRSEDVRARINVLSEMPAAWSAAIRSWRNLNRTHKTRVAGAVAPSANDEYLLYQSLVGVWPLGAFDPAEHGQFVERIRAYMRKAVREAKVHTSWVSPNAEYEQALDSFIVEILSPASAFVREFTAFQAGIWRAGILNSLSQVLLKIACTGVPDFYQGTELWDFSLVDPDNRRPVDFGLRRSMLQAMRSCRDVEPTALVERLIREPADGAIKLYITQRALRFRRANRDLFSEGDYISLRIAGPQKNHVIGFARRLGKVSAVALAGRFFVALGAGRRMPMGAEVWNDTAAILGKGVPAGMYHDLFTERCVSAEQREGNWILPMAHVFSQLPIALLVSEDETVAGARS